MASWRWAAASRRGSSHAARGERRQDAQRVLAAGSAFVVAVACDGAGSASFGGVGAALVARSISTSAAAWLNAENALPSPAQAADWVQVARAILESVAAARGLPLADFATTLVAAISDGQDTLSLHVGDGVIVCRPLDGDVFEAVSWPHTGDFASTTYFVTNPDLQLRIGMMTGRPIDRLAVLTDGLERLALDLASRVPHRRFFEQMFAATDVIDTPGRDRGLCRDLARFLDSAPVQARTDDDKTLILAALR